MNQNSFVVEHVNRKNNWTQKSFPFLPKKKKPIREDHLQTIESEIITIQK